jgi:uncharacterized protein YkwD
MPPRRRSTLAQAARPALLAALLLLNAPGARAATELAPQPAAARPPAPAARPQGWLEHLNFYRAAAGLPPVAEDPALTRGDRLHAIYIVKNGVLQHGEDPGAPWFSAEGRAAAEQSNLFSSDGTHETDHFVIDTWMQSPFHALGVLDPRLTRVGFGSYRDGDDEPATGAALNVLAGIDPRVAAAYPVFWPGDGAVVPLGLHWGGYPDALAGCSGYQEPCGLPLIVQFGAAGLAPVAASSLGSAGRPLEHCVFDQYSYSSPDPDQQRIGRSILAARGAVVIIPRFPLTAGTTYTASVTLGEQRHAWSFGIGGAAPDRRRSN